MRRLLVVPLGESKSQRLETSALINHLLPSYVTNFEVVRVVAVPSG